MKEDKEKQIRLKQNLEDKRQRESDKKLGRWARIEKWYETYRSETSENLDFLFKWSRVLKPTILIGLLLGVALVSGDLLDFIQGHLDLPQK